MPNETPSPSPVVEGARARARAEVYAAILESANRQLVDVGPAALSLRAVARDLGLASSAVYRYFDSRDALLTALIVEAYDSLGEHAERAIAATGTQAPARRWTAAALAIREWALANHHRYALLYGTPVPGYAAPDDTVTPGTRVSRALLGIVRQAAVDGRLVEDRAITVEVGPATRRSLSVLRAEFGPDARLSDAQLIAVVAAWTQVFGLVSFELFGQTRNAFTDDEAVFADAARVMAIGIGLAE